MLILRAPYKLIHYDAGFINNPRRISSAMIQINSFTENKQIFYISCNHQIWILKFVSTFQFLINSLPILLNSITLHYYMIYSLRYRDFRVPNQRIFDIFQQGIVTRRLLHLERIRRHSLPGPTVVRSLGHRHLPNMLHFVRFLSSAVANILIIHNLAKRPQRLYRFL